ncbi:AAA family ATPase [uncultured Ruminococcus sp.]|uniref:AAA family ATPase n=1 Tax=uncultured Ruminococcus sp. TaxID=165186 RepID=UPI0025F3A79B|nr:AAA family ATPase [uncultured Ruminococcus sp.]
MESLLNILKKIDPSTLDYQEWINVGMALKHEGFTAADWDSWSQSDSRYHAGECEQKWQGFNGSAEPVTAGTIIQMAKDRGLTFGGDFRELDWDSEISYEEGAPTVNTGEGIPIHEPENFDPVNEIVTYLETLFEAGDNVGYVTETWESEDKGKRRYLPTKGACDRTAGELIQQLKSCGGDIGAVLGDYKTEAGAWIRFNPLDGKGVKNENVTEYRYALVESDSMPIAQQHAVIRELELPVAVLVYSGGKSLHAIVRIDAPNYDEYRKRVDYLYKICKENGLDIDRQNRNPSRLSRLPGVVRGEHKQFIVDRNIGKSDFNEWKDYIESINDDLPDPESLSAEWDDMPELAQPLIEGVLRQGHKMLIAGPSKAGKSFALIELSIALAEGVKWLGFNCAQGRVLYVNLELDRASCLHRFKDVYTAMNLQPKNLDKLDIWNLRGRSVPMDKLAPKLIRRANKKNYIAVIIDPIYKVITGDENSADQMAKFCNQFDLICTELGTAVIYCHHHSKGSQGGKRSMDRASGSGVFARDPDALLDLTQLEITDALRKQQEDKQTCRIAENWLRRFYMENAFNQLVSQDDRVTPSRMLDIAHGALHPNSYRLMNEDIERAKATLENRTAWRIEGTLREFASFKPLNLWFDYPVHMTDEDKVLQDAAYEGEIAPQKKAAKARKKQAEEQRLNSAEQFINAYNELYIDEPPTMQEIATLLTKPINTVRDWAKRAGYKVDRSTGKVVSNSENE